MSGQGNDEQKSKILFFFDHNPKYEVREWMMCIVQAAKSPKTKFSRYWEMLTEDHFRSPRKPQTNRHATSRHGNYHVADRYWDSRQWQQLQQWMGASLIGSRLGMQQRRQRQADIICFSAVLCSDRPQVIYLGLNLCSSRYSVFRGVL